MNYVRSHLGVKLFLSFLSVILIGMVVIGIASRFSAPSAFRHHLGDFEQRFGPGGMMGPGGMPGPMIMEDFYTSYQASFSDALWGAVAVATGAALLASVLLSRGIISPLRRMMSASQRIAAGHYEERVETSGTDELAQLAGRFNQMAEKLEEVESMRRRLIGDVTHELRTPLTAIKGSMEGLIDGVLPATDETFRQIQQEADRLNRLVDDLQELSRVEAGAYSLEKRPLDVSTLVKTVTKRLRPQFDQKGVRLISSVPEGSMHVLVDEDRIIQVLTNLLANALHYTPAGGAATLSAIQADREIRISVEDTGLGISAEHLPLIFDRFYRVDKSRSRMQGGSGIGLTIAKHLVEAHGGRIWAESAGEGLGSRFTFSLPAVE